MSTRAIRRTLAVALGLGAALLASSAYGTAFYVPTSSTPTFSSVAVVSSSSGVLKLAQVTTPSTLSANGTIALADVGGTLQASINGAPYAAVGGATSVPAFDKTVTPVTVTNTTTETTVYSVTVPGGTLGTNNRIRVTLLGKWHGRISSNPVLNMTGYYGTASIPLTSVNVIGTTFLPAHIVFYVTAAGTTSSQGLNGTAWFTQSGLTGGPEIAGAIDSTTAQTLKITAQWNEANSGDVFTATSAFTEVLK